MCTAFKQKAKPVIDSTFVSESTKSVDKEVAVVEKFNMPGARVLVQIC